MATASAGSHSCFGLRLLWPLFNNLHFPILLLRGGPYYYRPRSSLSRPDLLSPPPHYPDQSIDATSPLTSLPAPSRVSDPSSSPVLTSTLTCSQRTGLDCRYPGALSTPTLSSLPRTFPYFPCLCVNSLPLLHWFSDFIRLGRRIGVLKMQFPEPHS